VLTRQDHNSIHENVPKSRQAQTRLRYWGFPLTHFQTALIFQSYVAHIVTCVIFPQLRPRQNPTGQLLLLHMNEYPHRLKRAEVLRCVDGWIADPTNPSSHTRSLTELRVALKAQLDALQGDTSCPAASLVSGSGGGEGKK
jgi:hypothetical protein